MDSEFDIVEKIEKESMDKIILVLSNKETLRKSLESIEERRTTPILTKYERARIIGGKSRTNCIWLSTIGRCWKFNRINRYCT